MNVRLTTRGSISGEKQLADFEVGYSDGMLTIRDTTYQYVDVDLKQLLAALDEVDDPEVVQTLTNWAIHRL